MIIFEKVRNFSAPDEGDCQTARLFAHWGPFGRQRRAWPHGQIHPIFTCIWENRPIFQNKGFPCSPSRIGCMWSPQDRWAPPEHPSNTSHTFSARCCRLPIRPVGLQPSAACRTPQAGRGTMGRVLRSVSDTKPVSPRPSASPNPVKDSNPNLTRLQLRPQ